MKAARTILKFIAFAAAVAAAVYFIAVNWDKISDAVNSLLEKLGIGPDAGGEWDDYADWED